MAEELLCACVCDAQAAFHRSSQRGARVHVCVHVMLNLTLGQRAGSSLTMLKA